MSDEKEYILDTGQSWAVAKRVGASVIEERRQDVERMVVRQLREQIDHELAGCANCPAAEYDTNHYHNYDMTHEYRMTVRCRSVGRCVNDKHEFPHVSADQFEREYIGSFNPFEMPDRSEISGRKNDEKNRALIQREKELERQELEEIAAAATVPEQYSTW